MALLNLVHVVDQLGVPFSSVLARRDLVSFSINQLNLLKEASRKISKIDPFDSSYPGNQVLTRFLRNGSRVLEESLSILNKNRTNTNLPQSNTFFMEQRGSFNNCDTSLPPLLDHSSGSREVIAELDRVLNDALISFITILGNSGSFFDNVWLFKRIIAEISTTSSNHSGLVCVAGIISKCDLFRIPEFRHFTDSVFSEFTRNRRVLRYLNDLDTTLILFHKIAMLYMSEPTLSREYRPGSTDYRTSPGQSQVPMFLSASIDKVSQMLNYTREGRARTPGSVYIKSVKNLIQTLFILFHHDRELLFGLPLDKLATINQLLVDLPSSCDPHRQEVRPKAQSRDKFSFSGEHMLVNNTSSLHFKVKSALSGVLDSQGSGRPESADACRGAMILDEVKIGSSMYFVDLLVS